MVQVAELFQASTPDWCNPLVAGRNKEPAHATLVPFADVVSVQDALQETVLDWARSPFVRGLDGEWRFYWSPSPASAPADFAAPNHDDGAWDVIAVPSNWQLLGAHFAHGKQGND